MSKVAFEEWWKTQPLSRRRNTPITVAYDAWQAALRHAAGQVRQMPVWKMCAEDIARAIEREAAQDRKDEG